MATFKKLANGSKTEIRTYVWDLTDDLLTGVTVSSATSVHTPPSGAAVVPTLAVSSPKVNITVPAVGVIGVHVVKAIATLSDGETSELFLIIPVVI